MHIDRMTTINDDTYQRGPLPSVRSISAASSPVDMTEGRTLPPLPPRPLPLREPMHRDPFNLTQKSFMPSPPSLHESFPAKASWPPMETMVPPLSPASTADSSLDSVSVNGPAKWRYDISNISFIDLIHPKPEERTRKKPLQQLCGRKRKASADDVIERDDSREKHRLAEGKRRQNLSSLLLNQHSAVPDLFLEMAGWDRTKNQTESKEHIVAGANMYIDFLKSAVDELLHEQGRLPRHLQGNTEPRLRCVQLERSIPILKQQVDSYQNQMERDHQCIQEEQQRRNAVERENMALKERMYELEHRLKAQEHMRSPKNEYPSLQQVNMPPESRPKASLPALQYPYDRASSSYGREYTFLNQTPPASGQSSPAYTQTTFSVGDSPVSHPVTMN